ncbi:MAG TPA: O-antigen ligase family protein [Paludibacter sp.]|nr:O-antigen ligase family protein [Paludibacter sp.]
MKRFTSFVVAIISVLLAIFLLKDTGLFVYKFLSDAYFLHLHALALLLVVLTCVVFQYKTSRSIPTKQSVVYLAWSLYVTLYFAFCGRCENYFCTYLLVVSIVSFSFTYLLRQGRIEPVVLYVPLVFLGVVESFATLLQYFHLTTSNSTNFAVTGTLDNPNITAMIVCMSIPALVEVTRLLKKAYRYVSIPVWMVVGIALMLLQCRTALIGTAIVVALWAWKGTGNYLSGSKYIKPVSIAVLVVLAVCVSVLQQQKEASANGRLTIWKVSAGMIAEKPLAGYGYGLFQREYNLHQADYFNRKPRPEQERMNAGYTAMAYNEYVEQTVMGGLPGGLLFAAMLLSLLWCGWKNRDTTFAPLTGVAAFAGMSLFNFTLQSPALLFSFTVYAAVLLAHAGTDNLVRLPVIPVKATVLSVLAGMVIVFFSIQKYNAQKRLKEVAQMLESGQIAPAGMVLDEIEPDISTSEAFYRLKAGYYMASGNIGMARESNIKALDYTSNPSVLMETALLSERLGKQVDAERYYKIACGIEPHLFRPRAMLMEMYIRTGQNQKAKIMANEILALRPKFKSGQVDKYKREAKVASSRL